MNFKSTDRNGILMKYSLILIYSFAFSQSAEEILVKSDKSRTFASESKVHIVIEEFEDNKLVSTELMDVYNNGQKKSLVKLTSRKDQLVLMVDDNMWIYFPKTRKPMRITPFQRLMGQASNGDIANLSYSEDYSSKILREERYLEKDCYVLELIAKSKASTYRKIHYWIEKKNYLPVKADYFMISGKHFKTAFFEDYKKVEGHTLVGKMRLFRVGQEENVTVMNFKSYEKKSLANKYFNMNYLRNVKL